MDINIDVLLQCTSKIRTQSMTFRGEGGLELSYGIPDSKDIKDTFELLIDIILKQNRALSGMESVLRETIESNNHTKEQLMGEIQSLNDKIGTTDNKPRSPPTTRIPKTPSYDKMIPEKEIQDSNSISEQQDMTNSIENPIDNLNVNTSSFGRQPPPTGLDNISASSHLSPKSQPSPKFPSTHVNDMSHVSTNQDHIGEDFIVKVNSFINKYDIDIAFLNSQLDNQKKRFDSSMKDVDKEFKEIYDKLDNHDKNIETIGDENKSNYNLIARIQSGMEGLTTNMLSTTKNNISSIMNELNKLLDKSRDMKDNVEDLYRDSDNVISDIQNNIAHTIGTEGEGFDNDILHSYQENCNKHDNYVNDGRIKACHFANEANNILEMLAVFTNQYHDYIAVLSYLNNSIFTNQDRVTSPKASATEVAGYNNNYNILYKEVKSYISSILKYLQLSQAKWNTIQDLLSGQHNDIMLKIFKYLFESKPPSPYYPTDANFFQSEQPQLQQYVHHLQYQQMSPKIVHSADENDMQDYYLDDQSVDESADMISPKSQINDMPPIQIPNAMSGNSISKSDEEESIVSEQKLDLEVGEGNFDDNFRERNDLNLPPQPSQITITTIETQPDTFQLIPNESEQVDEQTQLEDDLTNLPGISQSDKNSIVIAKSDFRVFSRNSDDQGKMTDRSNLRPGVSPGVRILIINGAYVDKLAIIDSAIIAKGDSVESPRFYRAHIDPNQTIESSRQSSRPISARPASSKSRITSTSNASAVESQRASEKLPNTVVSPSTTSNPSTSRNSSLSPNQIQSSNNNNIPKVEQITKIQLQSQTSANASNSNTPRKADRRYRELVSNPSINSSSAIVDLSENMRKEIGALAHKLNKTIQEHSKLQQMDSILSTRTDSNEMKLKSNTEVVKSLEQTLRNLMDDISDMKKLHSKEMKDVQSRMQKVLTETIQHELVRVKPDEGDDTMKSITTTKAICLGCGRTTVPYPTTFERPKSPAFIPTLNAQTSMGADIYRGGFKMPVHHSLPPSNETATTTTSMNIAESMHIESLLPYLQQPDGDRNILPITDNIQFDVTLPIRGDISKRAVTASIVRHGKDLDVEAEAIRPVHRKNFIGKKSTRAEVLYSTDKFDVPIDFSRNINSLLNRRISTKKLV